LRPNNPTLLPQLQLHLIVFIWGFTAILGDLISLKATQLVWYRMGIAIATLLSVFILSKRALKVDKKVLSLLLPAGGIIALHWVTFFHAIKISNVSLTLACMASGALFASVLEPLFFRKKYVWYEMILGLVVVLCLWMIFNASPEYGFGMAVALFSAFLSSLFAVINGLLVKKATPTLITTYELTGGWLLLTAYLFFTGGFTKEALQLQGLDWLWILILGTICTAFAFMVSVAVMRVLTPFTVVLTINLEPVYGILLAYFIFGEKEKMNPTFYGAAIVIVATVMINAWLKRRERKRSLVSGANAAPNMDES
jgi:drug/metabolite transporter (DMT)-like permease